MKEKNYEKRLEFQQKMIARQSKQIELLKSQVEELEHTIEEKDRIIKSVEHLQKELTDNVNDMKQKKKEYQTLIDELKKMKEIVNQTVYKNRWQLIKFLIK